MQPIGFRQKLQRNDPSENQNKPLESNPLNFFDSIFMICCDPKKRKNDKNILLHLAAEKNDVDAVKHLLSSPDIDVPDSSMKTLLRIAIENNYSEIIQELFTYSKATSEQFVNAACENLMHEAAKNGETEFLESLLRIDSIDVNKKDIHGKTALAKAVENDHIRTVEILLKHPKLDFNPIGVNENLLFGISIKRKNTQLTSLLLEKFVIDPNMYLFTAVKKGYASVVQALLALPATNVHKIIKRGKTAFDLARERGNIPILELFLNHPEIDVNKKNPNGRTLLHKAVENNNFALLVLLLRHPQIDLNPTDMSGKTPLDRAIACGNDSIIRLLAPSVKLQNEEKPTEFTVPKVETEKEPFAKKVTFLL